jgi:hypothetical protein
MDKALCLHDNLHQIMVDPELSIKKLFKTNINNSEFPLLKSFPIATKNIYIGETDEVEIYR